MPPIEDLAALEAKLSKRGFRRDDVFLHECPECHEQAVIKYITIGKTGGRDIALCQACGVAKSWRSVAGFQSREQDLAFDLRAFLR
jgi:transcription elongation factor Elf1